MSSQPQTYTPAQYLEAGHRAEMAGERERAAQYYHYLAEAFADSLEGEAARAGLARLGYAPRQQPQRHVPSSQAHAGVDTGAESHRATPDAFGYSGAYQQPAGPPHQGHAEHAPPQHAVQRAAPQQHAHQAHVAQAQHRERAAGPRIRLGELSSQPVVTRPAHAQGDVHGTSQAAQPMRAEDRNHDGNGEDALRLPEVVARRARELADLDEDLHFEKQYRGARLLAHLVTWLGWIVTAGGLALVVLGFAGIPPSLAGLIVGLPGGVVIGFSCAVAGLALALGGQVALATFDQAQTMREIGIMMRARVDL